MGIEVTNNDEGGWDFRKNSKSSVADKGSPGESYKEQAMKETCDTVILTSTTGRVDSSATSYEYTESKLE